MLTFEIDLI